MFGSLSGEGPTSPTGRGVASPGQDSQESSWIGLWSVVSRPALSFLQRRLPERPRASSGGLGLVEEQHEFLRQLEDLMPGPGRTLQESGAGEGRDTAQVQYFTRTLLGPVGLRSGSSQEIKSAGGTRWGAERRGTWWGSLWGLSPQPPGAETKAPAAEGPGVFGENTGPPLHKEMPDNNSVQNIEGSTADSRLSIRNHLSHSGVTTSSEEAPLTTEQDHGYSSLEEEQGHMKTEGQGTEPTTLGSALHTEMEQEEEEEQQEQGEQEQQQEVQQGMRTSSPQCQNKAIAFIMGCPCSDDDSQSDGESSDDDDAGFDSEGSSDASSSEDDDEEEEDDDEDSGGEADPEAERLWSSLCHSLDPYNPRNFTACLQTCSSSPRAVPTSTRPSSTQSTPASSPDLTPLPLSSPSSSSPSPGLDVWDDSTSASEGDEAESLLLWSSFSCSSDPYSPLNFQATLRTRGPPHKGPGARKGPSHTNPACPPEYRKEEAEERLDSGFSEPPTSFSSTTSSSHKKVRFCDDVEEFFTSSEEEEDRRGPWEELARDRYRFLRRCQEVEQSIAYCLQPQHRSRVSHRFGLSCSSSAPPLLLLCSPET